MYEVGINKYYEPFFGILLPLVYKTSNELISFSENRVHRFPNESLAYDFF